MVAPDYPPLVAGSSPIPIRTVADIYAQMPAWMRRSEGEPVTEALAQALLAVILEYQHRSAYGASQADVLRSTGLYLDGLGQDREYQRGEDELDEAYRSRVIDFPDLVTGWAIRVAVNALLAPYTSSQCQVFEPGLDRLFIEPPPGANWRAYIGRNPTYPTRLYEEQQAINAGIYIPNAEPRAARLYDDHGGRLLQVIVPDLAGLHDDPACVYSSTSLGTPDPREAGDLAMHVGDGSNSDPAAYLTADTATAESVYQAIISAVDRIRGHTVRWILMVDPSL